MSQPDSGLKPESHPLCQSISQKNWALVDEIKNFVDDGFVKPQKFYPSQTTLADVDQLPIRPNVFGLPARLTRPFRSTKTLIHSGIF